MGKAGHTVAMSYDRRVPEALLAVLRPGGFAHSLVEFGASGMWALDLQLRGLGERRKQYRATLYVGTTKVVDLHLRDSRFALSASPAFAVEANGWDRVWEQSHDAQWLVGRWPAVEGYLQKAIEQVVSGGRFIKEGMVQAAVGRFPATGFTVVDREAVVSFGSRAEKDACLAELSARWLGALQVSDPPSWWRTRPDQLGDECDVLALSSAGEILAIEIKPHTASARDIAWSVLQAGMYADLFRRWAGQVGGGATEVLEGMAEQRHQIGLAPQSVARLSLPLKVVPVVAIDRRASDAAVDRLKKVLSVLRSAGLAEDMRVRSVSLIGRLDDVA